MIIQVTQTDIDKAWKGSYNCPIAVAIMRQTGKAASVSSVRVAFSNNKTVAHAVLPPEASQFVIDYDAKQNVNPFEFNLDIPEI